jgi:hypothetical protein
MLRANWRAFIASRTLKLAASATSSMRLNIDYNKCHNWSFVEITSHALFPRLRWRRVNDERWGMSSNMQWIKQAVAGACLVALRRRAAAASWAMRSCHHAREEDEGIVSMEEMSLLQKEKKILEGEQHIETVKVK